MLQPKKPNPNQKSKRITPQSQYESQIDWDKVRSVNDNVVVQTAKMFDPTGISSYPDVYYAGKDLYEGKGTVGNLALNVLGALPMVNKAKVLFNIAKVRNASRTIAGTKKVFKGVEKIAEKVNKVTNPLNIPSPLKLKNQRTANKQISKADVKNLALDLLDLGNVGADVTSVGKAATPVVEEVSKVIKKELETPSLIDKKKIIQYYNTDPKRGGVEKPGQLANVQYVPVSNSAELKMWQEQKLALGTGKDGIEPKKRKLNVNLDTKGFADIGVEASHPNFSFNSGINFNPEELAGRVGASFNNKGFNSSINYSQKEGGDSRIDANLGYQNDLFQGNAEYSKTNEGDTFSGNLETGNDKLRVLMNYLSNPEGTNVTGGIQNSTNIGKGRLNSALEFASNFQDPKVSGNLNYTTSNGININAGTSYSKGDGTNINAGVRYNFALGTDKDGIMKKGMNPRKKYATGSNAKGIGPNNYIPSPNEVLSDYNIMLAKADQQVAQNSVVPIVALVGGLAQTALGMGKAKSGGGTGNFTVSGDVEDTTNPEFQSAIGDRPKAANGMNNVNADVEVEGGEMYETPQGDVGEFKGPSHAEGGIPLEVVDTPVANPNNGDVQKETKVYSKDLMLQGKSLAERKADRERQIANLEKTALQPLIDSAIKNATKRKMAAIQKEEMADLQFQEQVNNMQQMADTVVAAFGTSMSGVQANPVGESMRYGMGTGADGVTEYEFGTNENGIDPITMQQIQTVIGSNPDGTWGRRDRRKARKFLKGKDQTGFPSWVKGGEGITKNQQDMEWALKDPDFQKDFRKVYFGESTEPLAEPLAQEETGVQTEEVVEKPIDTVEPTQVQETIGGTTEKVNLPGTMFSRGLNKMGNKIGQKVKKLDEEGMIPGLGDLTGLFGNYLGATAGLKNAAEQRSTDVTHRNVFANAGKESQKQLDNAMNSIETAKAQAIVKATTTSQGGKRAAGNTSRSGNVTRAMNWLYDTALNEQIASISAGAAGQVSDIFKSKASTALSADQLSGQGEYQAAMANEAAKDAYYSAKGLGFRDQALGIQNIGKDLNAMKENRIKGNLMKDYGKWFSANANGISNKNNSTQSKGNNLEIPDGKGGTITMTREQLQELMKTINNGK